MKAPHHHKGASGQSNVLEIEQELRPSQTTEKRRAPNVERVATFHFVSPETTPRTKRTTHRRFRSKVPRPPHPSLPAPRDEADFQISVLEKQRCRHLKTISKPPPKLTTERKRPLRNVRLVAKISSAKTHSYTSSMNTKDTPDKLPSPQL